MDTQIGQTISADQFNKAYPVGSTLSADEFSKKYTQPSQNPDEGAITRGLSNTTVGTSIANALPGAIGQGLDPILNKIPGLNTKGFDVPVLGGIARGFAQPWAKAGETMAEGGRAAAQMLTGDKSPYQPAFVSPSEYKNLSGDLGSATVEGLRTGAGPASTVLPELTPLGGGGIGPNFDAGTTAISGGLGAIAEPLLHLLTSGKLTQKRLNDQMTKVKNTSVKNGDSMSYDDFKGAVNDKVEEVDPSEVNPELRTQIKKELVKRSPALKGSTETGLDQPLLDANWLHNLRKQMDAELGPQYWDFNQAHPVESQAKEIIRRAASEQLHLMVPATEMLDKINSIYYNPLIKGIHMGPLKAEWPESMTGVPSAIANTVGALGVGAGVKKLLGR